MMLFLCSCVLVVKQIVMAKNFASLAFTDAVKAMHVEAYDWNCPQHITPRYTVEDIEAAFAGQRNQITTFQAEVKALKNKLKEQGS